MNSEIIISEVRNTLVEAASSFREDKKEIYRRAIQKETNKSAKWILENTLENALVAERKVSPLCDDTGIPHVFLEIGKDNVLTGNLLAEIKKGIVEGLRALPGRPMAVKGKPIERIEQSEGLEVDPGALEMAPINIRQVDDDVLKLHILMQGGGPEIRGKTYRVFHKRNLSAVIDEVLNWAEEGAGLLGCTPCIPAIGIGRSHYEASSLMIEAMVFGNCLEQNAIESEITDRLNKSNIGPLGLGGSTTALCTFLRVGPQRASGIRVVSFRPCCSVEPRVATLNLKELLK